MNETQLKNIIEAALLAAGRTLSVEDILALFEEHELPERDQIRDAVNALQEDFAGRAIEIKQVASGYRIQVRGGYSEWLSRLWSERPSRYSRALLETLALIAYRQPITRSEIEDIRGVSVSSTIIKTMQERDWIRVLGHRDVPGKPAMYGTTKQFLDYFNLKSLDQLPTLDELRDLDQINAELDLGIPGLPEASADADADADETVQATADVDTTSSAQGEEPEHEELVSGAESAAAVEEREGMPDAVAEKEDEVVTDEDMQVPHEEMQDEEAQHDESGSADASDENVAEAGDTEEQGQEGNVPRAALAES